MEVVGRYGEAETSARILRAVAAKSLLDLLIVCALVAAAALANLHPFVRGAIDVADATRVAGWAYDPLSSNEALEVQLFIDGRFVASEMADERRNDLVERGATVQPGHGFTFRLAPLAPGRYEAQVYVVRSSFGRSKMLLPLSRTPIAFEVSGEAASR